MVQNLESFFLGLEAKMDSAKEFQELYNPVMAFEFNPMLHFFQVGENKLSQILAFFLDPKERHGQGEIFFKLFIEKFKLKIPPYSEIEIVCEHLTNENRRIDILISLDKDKYYIGIENKIWARDQKEQLSHYCDYLSSEHDNYCLIYLNPYSHNPSEYSIDQQKFRTLCNEEKILVREHASHTIDLIQEWIKNCKADKVRNFLKDFEQYLQHEINGETFMNEHEIILDFILKNEEKSKRIETALSLADTSDELKRRLFDEFGSQLKIIADELDLKLEFEVNIFKRWSGFYFYHNDLTMHNLCLGFEFDGSYAQDLYFGFSKVDNDIEFSEKFIATYKDKLSSFLGLKSSSGGWLCWDYFGAARNWSKKEYVDISNGKLKELFKEKINEILLFLKSIELINKNQA